MVRWTLQGHRSCYCLRQRATPRARLPILLAPPKRGVTCEERVARMADAQSPNRWRRNVHLTHSSRVVRCRLATASRSQWPPASAHAEAPDQPEECHRELRFRRSASNVLRLDRVERYVRAVGRARNRCNHSFRPPEAEGGALPSDSVLDDEVEDAFFEVRLRLGDALGVRQDFAVFIHEANHRHGIHHVGRDAERR